MANIVFYEESGKIGRKEKLLAGAPPPSKSLHVTTVTGR
jgi:hypothetical protein